jgi:hypothetical protein
MANENISTADKPLLEKIKVAVAAVNKAEKTAEVAKAELVSRSRAVGELLLEAKKRHPKVADFEAFLKRVDGLKRSRAYDCMRIAGGRATDEQLRQENRERVQKHRAKKKLLRPEPKPEPVSITHPDVMESVRHWPAWPKPTEHHTIEPEQRRVENTAEQSSARALAEFTVACRHWLPRVTVENDRQKARLLVAELTSTPKAEVA